MFNSVLSCGTVFKRDDNGTNIEPKILSNKNYDIFKEVYNEFGGKNLGELTEIYCKSDVLLLADIFEKNF